MKKLIKLLREQSQKYISDSAVESKSTDESSTYIKYPNEK